MLNIDKKTIYLEPRNTFDKCIIGYNQETCQLIYCFMELVCCYISLGLTKEETLNHISFNIIGMQINRYFPFVSEDKHE